MIMEHIINTELGNVKVRPVFDDDMSTVYKCYLLNGDAIIRLRNLHEVVDKMKERINNLREQKVQRDRKLWFRYR